MRLKRQPVKIDFDYFIQEYLYNCKSRNLRPKTITSYDQSLRLFERWALEVEAITTPSEVTEPMVRRYICDIQARGKYSFYANEEKTLCNNPSRRRDYREQVSITTINNYIRNLRAFFNWYHAMYPGGRNPMERVRQLEGERKAKEYLEDAEIHQLLRHFDKSYFPECRDAVIITLLLDTGMRLGECLALQTGFVDMAERCIEIPAELTKGRKSRVVFFSPKTGKALQQWLRFKDRYLETKYLFPTKATGLPVELRTFEKNFRDYVTRAGIKKNVSPHALRNNFAKRCLMAGMDIYTLSRILGHSSVTVTEQAYLDLTDIDLRRRYQSFSPIENLR